MYVNVILRALITAILALGLTAGTATTAVAGPLSSAPKVTAACKGKGCDNVGPKGAGCFATQRRVYNTVGSEAELMYSGACQAFWARSQIRSQFWAQEVHIEMQRRVDGRWKHARRLTQLKPVDVAPDWTNALGRRTKAFRFRAVLKGNGGSRNYYTAWKRGGRP